MRPRPITEKASKSMLLRALSKCAQRYTTNAKSNISPHCNSYVWRFLNCRRPCALMRGDVRHTANMAKRATQCRYPCIRPFISVLLRCQDDDQMSPSHESPLPGIDIILWPNQMGNSPSINCCFTSEHFCGA